MQKLFSDIYIDMLLYAIFLGYVLLNFKPTVINVAVLSLVFVSLTFWITSRIQLGGDFSVKPKATTLVTSGIYSKIRNPIYYFTAIADIGIIYLLGNKYLYLLMPVIVGLQYYRAKKEAQVLSQKFGKAYQDYRQNTWF